jgi:hypothetical protein
MSLTAKPQSFYNLSVSTHIFSLKIVQESAALSHQLQQAPPGMMVFLVSLEMFSKIADAFTEQRYLHFWRTGIGLMCFEILYYFLFPFSI